MAPSPLNDFVKEAIRAGRPRAEIRSALISAGWDSDQIDDALAIYADIDFPVPVPKPQQYGSAREAFLYIVFFALLGMVAGYVGALAFAFVESLFQDQLDERLWRAQVSGLRWGIAGLAVGYPIFIFLGARLGAARRRDSKRRDSRVRVWLTYVTLIIAAVVLIGDLVAVVYQFLSGELGARFLAKAGVVGLISGAIFWNFARDAERTDARADWPGRILAVMATIVAAGLVAWAITVARSPAAARAGLADERRIEDIGAIARLVDCHVAYFGALPSSLDEMEARLAERAGSAPVARGCAEPLPRDPATQSHYAYEALEGGAYRLCAIFERGWADSDARIDGDSRQRALRRWSPDYREDRYILLPEGAGEKCYAFEAVNFSEDDQMTDE
jgi:hypothetical protein